MATKSGTVRTGVAGHRRQRLRSIAIMPGRNEEASLGPLLAEIRAAEPDLGSVVITWCGGCASARGSPSRYCS